MTPWASFQCRSAGDELRVSLECKMWAGVVTDGHLHFRDCSIEQPDVHRDRARNFPHAPSRVRFQSVGQMLPDVRRLRRPEAFVKLKKCMSRGTSCKPTQALPFLFGDARSVRNFSMPERAICDLQMYVKLRHLSHPSFSEPENQDVAHWRNFSRPIDTSAR